MEQQQISTKRLLSFRDITITSVTWNLFGDLPPINSLVLLSKSQYFKAEPHIIFFGTQQCERALWMTLCCETKQNWQSMLRQAFPQYDLKVSEVMRGIHTAVLVQKKMSQDVQLYRINRLKTGACGLMGTKGALSISLLVKGDLLQLINCHLAANQEHSKQRNRTIAQIMDVIIQNNLETDIIFLGDFNYRIDMSKKQYELMLLNKKNNNEATMNYKSMLPKEQLRIQKQLREEFLIKFQQGPINFPPTYKLGLFEDQYHCDRIPGWTDRIFHRTNKTLQRTSYGSLFNVKGCDHRPVLATYIKSLSGKEYRMVKNETNNCQII